MTRPNCNTCAHRTGATVWCSTIAECDHHQARSIPLHVSNLTSLAKRGDREAWREYIDTVRSREGERTAQQLKAAFAAAWSPT